MAARACSFVSAVLALCLVAGARAGALEVEMYRGGFASVNSFIFSNGKTQIVMDVQRKSYGADRFIEQVKAKKSDRVRLVKMQPTVEGPDVPPAAAKSSGESS